MKKYIVVIEFLNFGFDLLVKAADEMGYFPVLLTQRIDSYTYAIKQADSSLFQIVQTNTTSKEILLNSIKKLESTGKICGVVSATDTFAFVSQYIANFYKLPILNKSALVACRNKDKTRQILREANLCDIYSCKIDHNTSWEKDIINNFSLPFIIKDSSGTGSKSIYLCNSKNEFEKYIGSINKSVLMGDLLAEEYVTGTLYSAESITFNSKTKTFAISGRVISKRPKFKEEIITLPVNFPKQIKEKIDKFIADILKALSYTLGFSHIEFMITKENELKLIEVNPRLGGALIGPSLVSIFDINIYKDMINLSLGNLPILLNENLYTNSAKAHILIYAPYSGIYNGLDGINSLNRLPGSPKIFPILKEGDIIKYLDDQRSCVAMLISSGYSCDIALYNLLNAFNSLTIKINKENLL